MANIADDTNLIRTATYGKDMREAIADGIEDINAEVESTTARQATVEGRQDDVEETFQEVINLGGNPSAEVVQARTDTVNSITYDNLQDRLDANASSLAENPNIQVEKYFQANQHFSSTYFRIPFCEITNNDVLIVGGDVRYDGSNDVNKIDIGIARSLDYGKTFIDKKIALQNSGTTTKSRVHDGLILVNRNTNRVFIFGLEINSDNSITGASQAEVDFVYKYSDDDGVTWSVKQSLKSLFPVNCIAMYSGVGKGITMKDGTLVVPIQVKQPTGSNPLFQSGIIISNDNGATWAFNGGLLPVYSSECNVVESQDGMLLINARSNIGKRRIFNSWDKGTTWNPYLTDAKTLVEPGGCQGSSDIVTIGNTKFGLFINPNESEDNYTYRKNITLKATNDFVRWYPVHVFTKDSTDGYSCITNKDNKVFAVIERKGDLEFYNLTNIRLNIPNIKIDSKVDATLELIHYNLSDRSITISPTVSIVRVPTISGNIIEKIKGADVGQIITLVKAGAEFYLKTSESPLEDGIYGHTSSSSNDLIACLTSQPITLQYTLDKKWVVLNQRNYAKDRHILTLDANGYITITPSMKMIAIDVVNSQNTMFKGIKNAIYGQEIFITNLDTAYPLSFNYNIDILPTVGDEIVTASSIYFPHIRADIKNNYDIDNIITYGQWLHCVISDGYAELVNIMEFAKFKKTFIQVTGYTQLGYNAYVYADASAGGFTLDLPSLSSVPEKHEIKIKKLGTDTNTATIRGKNSELIDVANTLSMSGVGEQKTFVKLSGVWRVF